VPELRDAARPAELGHLFTSARAIAEATGSEMVGLLIVFVPLAMRAFRRA
jgi:hypothetical protein